MAVYARVYAFLMILHYQFFSLFISPLIKFDEKIKREIFINLA